MYLRSQFVSIVLLALILQITVLQPARVNAETQYIKPTSEVVVRRGQGTEFKILAMVKDGTPVEFIAEENSYARIRLNNGVVGWLPKRFLTTEPPVSLLVESLRKENIDIGLREARSAEELEQLSASLLEAKTKLAALLSERDEINDKYQTLLSDTANVLEIKKAQQSASKENLELVEKLALAEQENGDLTKNKNLHWFLAGAGVFLIGIFFGKLPKPTRRRKSSLL